MSTIAERVKSLEDKWKTLQASGSASRAAEDEVVNAARDFVESVRSFNARVDECGERAYASGSLAIFEQDRYTRLRVALAALEPQGGDE